MSNKDFLNLGNVYSDMFATLEDNLVSEGAVESVGEAPLTDGGPQEKGGFVEPEVDITKDKDKYNIKNLSYGNSEDISSDAGDNTDGDAVVGHENEEDEEILHETEKIAKERLNNFMKRKSVFDKLYDKVMVNENLDELEAEDLDSLGLDDATPDDELDDAEITVTLDKSMAKALHDVLMTALGGDDELEDVVDADDALGLDGDEDEEGAPTALNTHYNDGKDNKVGNFKAKGGADTGAPGVKEDGTPKAMNTHYNDGKDNKVGTNTVGEEL
tara:strand:+ start:553 stop:1368 length:816 start_codon:yes stop_codon:yes gene_type:complete